MSKVHATPRKRNITLRYDVTSTLGLSEANRLVSSCNKQHNNKKLRRLPHIFAKVLQLPFHSNTNVLIQETPNSFRFSAVTDCVGFREEVMAHTIEIYPGVTKIVIRGGEFLDLDLDLDELEIDLWRFRLPDCTVPEMTIAQYLDGELVVVVPKGVSSMEDENDADDGNANRCVLVH